MEIISTDTDLSKILWNAVLISFQISYKFQINQPARCNNFSILLLDVYVQLNMFRASSRPTSGAQQLQQQPLVLPLERGGSSAVGRGRAGRPGGPTTTNSTATTYHLEIVASSWLIYFNCMMMHGLANFEFTNAVFIVIRYLIGPRYTFTCLAVTLFFLARFHDINLWRFTCEFPHNC